MNIPQVRIRSSFLLNNQFIPLILPGLEESGNEIAATDEFIDQKVAEYNKAWEPYESRVLHAMSELLNVEFHQNIIDVYIMPIRNAFSDLMIISTKYSQSDFVNVLTHELIHRILTDNSVTKRSNRENLLEPWKKAFGDEHSFVTLVHIPVHAVLEYIFVDILNEPDRLASEIAFATNSEYVKAVNYVREHGYRPIITQLQAMYSK